MYLPGEQRENKKRGSLSVSSDQSNPVQIAGCLGIIDNDTLLYVWSLNMSIVDMDTCYRHQPSILMYILS
jgi:hypothetical protein